MDFSKLKLNRLAESVNPNAPAISMPKSGGTSNAYFDAEGTVNSRGSGEQSRASTTRRVTRDSARKQQQNFQKSPRQTQSLHNPNVRTGPNATPKSGLTSKTTNPTIMSNSYQPSGEHLKELRQEQELLRRLRENKSDWRSDLNENAAPEPLDKEMHPYVDVMPHADQNVRTLKKQMLGQAVEKVGKDIKQEEVEVDTEYLEEKKKKCKDGYKYDKKKKKCVKKKKKSSSSKKSSPTYVYVGRPRGFYGGSVHHHHHHDDDGDKGETNGNGGNGGNVGGGDAGGGGGE